MSGQPHQRDNSPRLPRALLNVSRPCSAALPRAPCSYIEQHIFREDGGPFHGVEGSGKTEMLDSGGVEVEVVFVDTDYHFDMLRSETEEAVRCCLRRLSVIHCSSSVQLLLTLTAILRLYWMDRSSGGESLARQESNLRKCAELLNKLRRDYGIVCSPQLTTTGRQNRAALRLPEENVMDFDKLYLCRTWQKILTHRLVFSKSEQSLEAVDQKQVFSVACSTVRTKCVKRCTFHVTEGGVQFIDEKLQK
uniref:X-ray repair cross complementing 2 n=1 Tax=Astyanax mexicanus TaxID=7994 RepID=A0A3B1INE6_ASTMX